MKLEPDVDNLMSTGSFVNIVAFTLASCKATHNLDGTEWVAAQRCFNAIFKKRWKHLDLTYKQPWWSLVQISARFFKTQKGPCSKAGQLTWASENKPDRDDVFHS